MSEIREWVDGMPPDRLQITYKDQSGPWFVAADVCRELGLTMRYVKSMPAEMRSTGLDGRKRKVLMVSLAGVLWLVYMAGTRESLPASCHSSVCFVDKAGVFDPGHFSPTQKLMAWGAAQAIAAVRAVNEPRQRREREENAERATRAQEACLSDPIHGATEAG